MRVRGMLLLAGLLACGTLLGGCTAVVHARPRPAVHVAAYRPLVYHGEIVYFTASGVPYVWIHGARVYIPPPYRRHYTTHYYNHRDAYVVWARSHGHPGHDHHRISSSHRRTGRHGATSSGASGGSKRSDGDRGGGAGSSKRR